jgi:hypothetical protein
MEMPDEIVVMCVSILLVLVAGGVYLIVWSGNINESFTKLLQEKDYNVNNKSINKKVEKTFGWIGGVYWSVLTALYIGVSFITDRWDITWIVWIVAGCVYGVIKKIIKARVEYSEQSKII